MNPWEKESVVEKLGKLWVVRDDLLEGGTKIRFLPLICAGAKELVYGGPFCGGAALALSVVGKYLNVPVTLFYAQRSKWHPRQLAAERNGAKLMPVPFGYLSNVQAKARKYCEETGAFFLPMGFDIPAAREALIASMTQIRATTGVLDEIYLATGSGMLASCAAIAWPEAKIVAVCVGLSSRYKLQQFPKNVSLVEWPTTLDKPAELEKLPPFPCCPYYEQKAWDVLQRRMRKSAKRRMFWNVLGDPQ